MPTTIGYTGQRRDTGLGSLMFYNARYYSPLLSHFVSADSIVPGAGNPQALNRYAYVLGNPLKYTDPSGHDPCTGIPGTYMPDCGVDGWGVKPGKTKPAKPAWKTYTGDHPFSRGYDPPLGQHTGLGR